MLNVLLFCAFDRAANAFYFNRMITFSGKREKSSWFLILVGIVFVIGCGTGMNSEKRNYSNSEKARMLVEIANGALSEGDSTGALQSLARAEELDDSVPELYHSRALA